MFFFGAVNEDACLDFVEELACDATGMGRGGMKRNWNGIIDRPLETGAVGNDRLEGVGAERFAYLCQVSLLKGTCSLKLRDNVTEQAKIRVIM